MSYELLLVAGPSHPDAAGQRDHVVRRAAGLLPGARSWQVHSSAVATVALVECLPAGGGAAVVQLEDPHNRVLGVATHEGRVDADALATSGAEQAAVVVSLLGDEGVRVCNDGTGLIAAHYAEDGDYLWLSTTLAGMFALGRPMTWDETSVVEYLALLHPLGERTLVKGISVLKPGTTAHWRDGRSTWTSQSLLVPPADSTTRSDADAVEEFGSIWADVVADLVRRAPATIGVGLSGGLDSRSIAIGLRDAGDTGAVAGFTFGSREQHEVRVAELVARRLGMAHEILPVTPAHMLRGAAKTVGRLDGTHSYAELYESWFDVELTSRFGSLVSGLAGDCLWGSDRAFGAGAAPDVGRSITGRYLPYLGRALPFLDPELAGRAGGVLAAGIEETVGAVDRGRADTSTYWNLGQRQRRWGYALGTATRRFGLTLEAPFLDRRVLAFARAMTPDQRAQGRLHALVQQQVFAATADIPRGNDGNAPAVLERLYLSDSESLVRQNAALARTHPVAATRRFVRYTTQRAATELQARAGLTRPADMVARRRSVFRSAQWLRSPGAYRDRTAELVEQAASDVPAFLRTATLRSALDTGTPDPFGVARAVSLCLWGQQWSRLASEAVGSEPVRP